MLIRAIYGHDRFTHFYEADAALQVWKDVTFDFASTDTPDYVVTPTVA